MYEFFGCDYCVLLTVNRLCHVELRLIQLLNLLKRALCLFTLCKVGWVHLVIKSYKLLVSCIYKVAYIWLLNLLKIYDVSLHHQYKKKVAFTQLLKLCSVYLLYINCRIYRKCNLTARSAKHQNLLKLYIVLRDVTPPTVHLWIVLDQWLLTTSGLLPQTETDHHIPLLTLTKQTV